MTKDAGEEMIMYGVHREIVAPERIVQAERFEKPCFAGEGRNTSTFVAEMDALLRAASKEIAEIRPPP